MRALIIHTRGEGVLADTSADDVVDIARQVCASKRAVIHLQGGLVTKEHAVDTAARLGSFYSNHNILPVFFIWESGLLETIRNNKREIFDEKIFKSLLKMLLKWVGGKVVASIGGRSMAQASPLDDLMVEKAVEGARRAVSEPVGEPLSNLNTSNTAPLTTEDHQAFEKDLRENREFRIAFDSLMLGLDVEPPKGRTAIVGTQRSSTHLSESVKEELRSSARATSSARGFFDPVTLIVRVSLVLARIVKRCLQGRDHGLYTTAVEELLRDLYIDAIGTWVWGRMKKDTEDSFKEFRPDRPRGGRLFVDELGEQLRLAAKSPKLSIVGHSAGTIFACHLLQYVNEARSAGSVPRDFIFDRVAFLASACQISLFHETLLTHERNALFREFRLYSLGDALESGYWEAPPLYPRSLLYMVSGIFELPDYDVPLLGMQRYITQTQVYSSPEVCRVREFLGTGSRDAWSEFDGGDGFRTDANRHGAFDATEGKRCQTMKSVVYFLNS